jgi:hypothetical protein
MVRRDGTVLLQDNSPGASVQVLQSGQPAPKSRHRARIALLLPRRDYLLKTLETPEVSLEEAGTMLPLEVEAQLPPDYGAVEVAHRRLKSQAGKARWEVYIARKEVIEGQLALLQRLGLRPEFVVPSAVTWAGALKAMPEVDLIVAAGPGLAEAASTGPAGAMLVRALEEEPAGGPSTSEVVEFVRSLSASLGRQPIRVGWVGPVPQPNLDRMAEFIQRPRQGAEESREPLLELAASGVGELEQQTLSSANLMPAAALQHRARMGLCRHAAVSMGFLAASMLLVWAAIQLRCERYRGVIAELDRNVAHIKGEGEIAGRRVSQMLAVRAALDSSRDFYNVIEGLLKATPEGVTYNQVELLPSGELLLRGQAQSVSLPFLLPEQLQRQATFDQVVLQSAGQKSRGSGSVTEFHLECRLKRGVKK